MASPSVPDRIRAHVSAALDWYGPGRAFATAGSVVVVCIGAWWLLRAPSPPLEASLPFASSTVTIAAAPTLERSPLMPAVGVGANGDITVHVVGAVVAPGVYVVAASSRVVDAVTAAGGATAQADLSSVNMALPLTDADQVYVPSRGQATVRPAPPSTKVRRTNPTIATVAQAIAAASTTLAPAASASPDGVVNINTADVVALEALPGVGPATAKAIVAHRQANGPFARPEDLLEVKGIGDGKFATMKRFVSVS